MQPFVHLKQALKRGALRLSQRSDRRLGEAFYEVADIPGLISFEDRLRIRSFPGSFSRSTQFLIRIPQALTDDWICAVVCLGLGCSRSLQKVWLINDSKSLNETNSETLFRLVIRKDLTPQFKILDSLMGSKDTLAQVNVVSLVSNAHQPALSPEYPEKMVVGWLG